VCQLGDRYGRFSKQLPILSSTVQWSYFNPLMEKQRFKALVGKKFFLFLGGATIELELVSLRELPSQSVPGLRAEPFALLFRGPLVQHYSETLPRQVHQIQAPDEETFTIYLEPVVSTGDPGTLYEAIYD
jgi:hypothetical protein